MENGQKEGVCVQGRRVPITKGEFERPCDVQDEGAFTTQRGLWQKMEKTLVEIQSGGPDFIDEISEVTMMHTENRRIFFASEEHEFCGHGHVKGKIGFSR